AWIVYGQDPATLPANDAASGLVPANANDHTHSLALASLTPQQGTKLEGQTAGERLGRQVTGIGDVDGNGAADVAFGADMAAGRGRGGAGEATVALLPGPPPAFPQPPRAEPGDPGRGQPNQPAGPGQPSGPGAPAPPGGSGRPAVRAPAIPKP